MQIREGKKEDLPVIYNYLIDLAKLGGLEDRIGMSQDDVYDILFGVEKKWCCYVGETGGKIAGFIIYTVTTVTNFYNSTDGFHIIKFFVLEQYRRHGLGKKLIAKVCLTAKKSNVDRIELYSMHDNELANRFYKNLGFDNLDYVNFQRLGVDNILKIIDVVNLK